MRFAVLSDIHGNVLALRRVIVHLETQGVDGVINLGDCVSGPLWPQETFDALAGLGAVTVRGNHDRWLGDPDGEALRVDAFTRAELSHDAVVSCANLPSTLEIAGEILAVHGTPGSDTEYLLEDDVDGRLCLAPAHAINERLSGTKHGLVLCGHSHQQNSVWAAGQRLVLNPGSVGCPRYAGNAAPRRNEAGSPHARYAVVTQRAGVWSAELFVLDYDWAPVISRARSVGFDDWADGFGKDD